MNQNFGALARYTANVDHVWFYEAISTRLSLIEDDTGQRSDSDKELAAVETMLLYYFFIDYLKASGKPTSEVIRDYYHDFQYLISVDLVTELIPKYEDYMEDENTIQLLSEILPKNPTDEEAGRFPYYATDIIAKAPSEFCENPEKARDYLLSSLKG